MPSSFVDSVPSIVKAVIDLSPRRILDIGPGWGKYGLMSREYLGSKLERLDAIEVPQGRLYTQDVIYDNIYEGDVRQQDIDWSQYDLVLFIDVIEHLEKEEGQKILKDIVNAGCAVLVSTPKEWMEQHDDNNPYEEHISYWTWEDLWYAGMVECDKLDTSTIDSMIITLCPRPEDEQMNEVP